MLAGVAENAEVFNAGVAEIADRHGSRRPLAGVRIEPCRNAKALRQIGNAYYDSLMQSDGEAAPFAEDCARRENGMHTAGVGAPPPQPGALPLQGCAEQLHSRAMSYITSIDLRRA